MDNHQTNPLQKYFRQPKIYVRLPSNGEFYPDGSLDKTENGEYPVYPMTTRDEIMIKTPDALLNGESTVEVIQSCIPNIKNAWDIPIIDMDAILIGIRIATYGESMELSIKTPVTAEEKDYQVDLRTMLDSLYESEYDNSVILNEMQVKIRPLTYREFTETSIQTFEEQRIFNALTDREIPESKKLQTFNDSFKKLTDLTIHTLEKSIKEIVLEDTTVTNPEHIKEFVNNADKTLFEKVTNHVDEQRTKFSVKPLTIKAEPEEIEKGVPETYEVPITFDQANFFE